MSRWIIDHLWLIPAVPFAASLVILSLPNGRHKGAATLAVAGQIGALVMSFLAFLPTLQTPGFRAVQNFTWFTFGDHALRLGWLLDPLAAVMLMMITLVGLCIFVFSTGYMAGDKNFVRFFAYLSFFSGAMLGLIISNSLLLLFICWELVGLASYLLIGFWIERPSAAAAAKKAFVTTRIGDLGFFLGLALALRPQRHASFLRPWQRLSGKRRSCHDRRERHVYCAAHFLRRSGQVGAIPVARLVAGCDGRPDSGQRIDPCRNDGCCRRVSGRPRVSGFLVRRDQRGDIVANGRRVDWSNYGIYGRAHRDSAGRHQTHPRVFDCFSTRFDDGFARRGRRRRRDDASAGTRFFQGAAVSGRGLGHSRLRMANRTFGKWAVCAGSCQSRFQLMQSV